MPQDDNRWPLHDPDGEWAEWELLHPDKDEQARVAEFFVMLQRTHGYYENAIPILAKRDQVQALLPDPCQVWAQWGIDEAGEKLYVIDVESLHDVDMYHPGAGPWELPDK